MYKVLVFGMTDNYGGVERVIINYYHQFDNNKIHFDFICNTPHKMAFEDQLKKQGSKVFHLIERRKNPFKYNIQMENIFSNYGKDYDCFWCNLNNLVNVVGLKLAKKYGIPKIVVHSHNSKIMEEGFKGKIKLLIHKYNKKKICRYSTDYWACSSVAAEWLFPKKCLNKVYIVKNAIDLKRCEFSIRKRNEVRKSYGLTNSYVIGNVGRLHFQKNQEFMLHLLKEILPIIPNAKLVFVGDGPDKEKLLKEVDLLGLKNKVLFTGVQKDISSWYSAFDLFLFPSRFEGLSVAMLEAQSNGLPIIASNNVSPNEIKINSNVEFLPLDCERNKWIREIKLREKDSRVDIREIKKNFIKHGYDIKSAGIMLEKKFLE